MFLWRLEKGEWLCGVEFNFGRFSMINGRMLQLSPISSCRRWFEVILWHIYYVMSCVRPQLGADCFRSKWAVDSSYSWNIHCFQIRWRICHSVGIGIKGSSCNRVNAAMNPVSIVAGCRRQKQSQWNLQTKKVVNQIHINNN